MHCAWCPGIAAFGISKNFSRKPSRPLGMMRSLALAMKSLRYTPQGMCFPTPNFIHRIEQLTSRPPPAQCSTPPFPSTSGRHATTLLSQPAVPMTENHPERGRNRSRASSGSPAERAPGFPSKLVPSIPSSRETRGITLRSSCYTMLGL